MRIRISVVDLGGVGQRFMSVALKDKKFDFFEIIS